MMQGLVLVSSSPRSGATESAVISEATIILRIEQVSL